MPYESFQDRPHERFTGYEDELMMPEVNEAIQDTFTKLELPAVLSCGDDRGVAEESMKHMVKEGLPMEKPFIRLFGGKYGAANILAVTAVAQYGPEHAKHKLGSNIHSLADETAGRAADRGVFMVSHSSAGAEGNTMSVASDGDAALGCARIAAMGKVNQLSATDQLAIRVAEADSEALFGRSGQESGFHRIPGAFAAASHIYFGAKPETFSISRRQVQNSDVMILNGDHAKTDNAIHVINLKPDMISDVSEALMRGLHYYDSDVTVTSELLLRSFPELRLDPQIMLNVMLADQAATRMALAAADGPADPQRLPSQRFGDGRQSLDYLSAIS